MKKKSGSKYLVTAIAAFALTLGTTSAGFAVDEPLAAAESSATSSPVVARKDRAAIEAFKAAKADFQVAIAAFRTAKADYEVQKAAYQAVMEELRPTLKAYSDAKKVIGQTFATTVRSAKATYDAVLASDASAEDKLAAKTTFEQAKSSAAAARSAAIEALGPAPVKPAAPVKPTKPVKPARP